MPWKLISRALTAEGKKPLERRGTPRRLPYRQALLATKTREKTNAARPTEKATYVNQNNPGQP